MLKRAVFVLVILMILSRLFAVGSGEKDARKSGKKTIRVMSFTDEVPRIIEKYFDLHPEDDALYDVEATIISMTDGLYQPSLDVALTNGGSSAPDIYCADASFVLKYSQGDAAQYAATYSYLGIDVDGLALKAEIAPYTIDIGTRDGEVVALAYQATGGAFIYNRSVAKDAFGSDERSVVEKKIGAGSESWETFLETAAELRSKGYAIVSGDGDVWHAVENSSEKGWIVDDRLYIDPKREAFLDLSKSLKDGDYHNDTQDWQEGWFADMKEAGKKKVLGFFGPAWLINYTLAPNCGGSRRGEGTFGDWGVCTPNVGFFWGGTWLFASRDTGNADIVGRILQWITLDSSETGFQHYWASGTLFPDNGTKDCVTSGKVMKECDGSIELLSGQNMFDVYIPTNGHANGDNLSQYDEIIDMYWRDQVRQYSSGAKSREEAIRDFELQVAENLDYFTR